MPSEQTAEWSAFFHSMNPPALSSEDGREKVRAHDLAPGRVDRPVAKQEPSRAVISTT